MKASQRQEGALLSTDFRPEQQVPSGLVMVLSFVTNDKQSAMVRIRLEQSTEGDGACCVGDEAPWARSTAQMATTTHRMSENFVDAMKEKWECSSSEVWNTGMGWGVK